MYPLHRSSLHSKRPHACQCTKCTLLKVNLICYFIIRKSSSLQICPAGKTLEHFFCCLLIFLLVSLFSSLSPVCLYVRLSLCLSFCLTVGCTVCFYVLTYMGLTLDKAINNAQIPYKVLFRANNTNPLLVQTKTMHVQLAMVMMNATAQ